MKAWLAFAATWLAAAQSPETALELPTLTPPCRKSPDLSSLLLPSAHGGFKQQLLVFGGKGWVWKLKQKKKKHKMKLKQNVKLLKDVWTFDLERRTWQELPEVRSPSKRWKMGSTTFANATQLVLFGGCSKSKTKFVKNDLWVFNPQVTGGQNPWRYISTENSIARRRGHVVVANLTHIIVFGGKTHTKGHTKDRCLSDLWALPKTALEERQDLFNLPRWSQGASFPSGCRWGASGDLLRGSDGRAYLALFGGRWLNPGYSQHTSKNGAYTYYGELWLYDFEANTWSQAPNKGDVKPEARDHHGAATLNGDLYIYGGRREEKRQTQAVLADVWSYSLRTQTWTQHQSLDGFQPSARYMPGVSKVVFQGQEMLAVFGGETLPGSTKRTTLNDVWLFDPDKALWLELATPSCSLPFPVTAVSVAERPVEADQSPTEPDVGKRLLFGVCLASCAAFLMLGVRTRSQRAPDPPLEEYLKL